MVGAQPSLHAIEMPVTNHEDEVFRPVRVAIQEVGEGKDSGDSAKVVCTRQTLPRSADDDSFGS